MLLSYPLSIVGPVPTYVPVVLVPSTPPPIILVTTSPLTLRAKSRPASSPLMPGYVRVQFPWANAQMSLALLKHPLLFPRQRTPSRMPTGRGA